MRLSARTIARILSSLAEGREVLQAKAAAFFGMDVPAAPSETLARAIATHWPGERLMFTTSGSTGEPRSCVREMLWLVQEACFLAGLFEGGKRVVSLVPAHHIYGFLFAALLPELLDAPVLDLKATSLTSLAGILEPGDIVLGFPLLWKKCGEIALQYPEGVTGVTSTGPCRPEIIRAALAGGLSRMAEIHGATETGGLGHRFHHAEPYRLMDHWAVSPGKTQLLRVHPHGGPAVPFLLPDELRWEGERLYRPTGRKDKAVQIGGVNVYPERVRRVLMEHPLVKDAAVRLMRPQEGDRLKAYVVPVESVIPSGSVIRDLRAYLAGALSPPEIPRSFTLGAALPKSALGKDADWSISS